MAVLIKIGNENWSRVKKKKGEKMDDAREKVEDTGGRRERKEERKRERKKKKQKERKRVKKKARRREEGGLDSAIFATRIIISYLTRPVASRTRCVRLPRLSKKNM